MVKHHFFGRDCKIDRQLNDYSDLKRCLKVIKWDFENINFVNQTHSSEVYVIDDKDKIQGVSGLAKADAIVTNHKNLVIAVVTADCSPIILQDEKNSVVSVVHAGWRGAKNGVIENAIDAMVALGADISSLEAFIGPMIHQKSYQVSQEFYDDFTVEDKNNSQFFKNDKIKDKYLFDLPAFVTKVLSNKGVLKIDNVQIDTYENCDKYSSYRKSSHDPLYENSRNISVVMI